MIGFVNVNKPEGMSSSKVVSILKKQFHLSKIGHMGTLDPLAEGVLPIAIGKATRMFDYFLTKKKTYIADFKFGETTDTLDREGQIIGISEKIPTKAEIEAILPDLMGEIDQLPPIYSAKKVNGKCAYDYARQGQKVQLKTKKVVIDDIKLIKQLSEKEFRFEITCGSGTYIRSIARDMAQKLNSKAYMSKLTRIKSGKFDIEKSFTLEEISNKNLDDIIVSVEEIFDNMEVVDLNQTQSKKLLDGLQLNITKIDGEYLLKCDIMLLGVGQVKDSTLRLKTCLKEEK